jgi:polyisoprenoid-binding protein YceI
MKMKKSFINLLTIAILFFATLAVAETEKSPKTDVDTKESKLEWRGKKLTGEHYGNISIQSGQLAFNGNKLTGGSFVIDMNSITCLDLTSEEYNKKLVGHLKSDDFFSTSNFPTAKFDITKVEHKGGENYSITGNLTIKGITHPLTFPASVSNKDGKSTATASIVFDRSKYNVKYGSKTFFESIGDKVIYDDVELKVELVTSTTVAKK